MDDTMEQLVSLYEYDEDLNCTIGGSYQPWCNITLCPNENLTNCTNSSAPMRTSALDPLLVEFQEQSRFWIQRILVPVIMAIGVIDNTITIVIMTQRRMRSSTNCYLAALAVFDMSYLMFSFLLSIQHYPNIHSEQYNFYWRLYPYFVTIADASSNSSVWLTVTFTIERYIAVCHPMKGKVMCTESRAQKMVIFILVTCSLITLPTGFEYKLTEVVDPVNNSTLVQVGYSELGMNPVYVSVYYWIVSVLFIIAPFIVLAVFNTFLIRSVHSSKTRRKTMTRRKETGDQSQQESKITVMLIAVVFLFFVCQLPTAVILLYRTFHHVDADTNEDLLLRGLGNIFNFLMAVNAAGNFVLYCLLSRKYRRTFVQIFCPCFKEEDKRFHTGYQNTVYSTMDTESPRTSRNYSAHASKRISKRSTVKAANKPAYGQPTRQPSYTQLTPNKVAKLESPNAIVAYDSQPQSSPVDDTYKRLLRGFRCPWKRQKISSSTGTTETPQEFVPLRPTLTRLNNHTNDVEIRD